MNGTLIEMTQVMLFISLFIIVFCCLSIQLVVVLDILKDRTEGVVKNHCFVVDLLR